MGELRFDSTRLLHRLRLLPVLGRQAHPAQAHRRRRRLFASVGVSDRGASASVKDRAVECDEVRRGGAVRDQFGDRVPDHAGGDVVQRRSVSGGGPGARDRVFTVQKRRRRCCCR